MREFLNNFQKRMQFIAPIYLIAQKLSNSLRYKDYDLMNLTFSVLCYLQEYTLTEGEGDGLDVIEIGDFLFKLINGHYNQKISKNDAVDMARFIIEEVIENSGEMLQPQIQDFEKGRTLNPTIKLIKAKTEIGMKNKYKLTHAGIEILFRTDEVDSEMRLTMEAFILKNEITRGNYDKAIQKTKKLVNMSYQLKIEIEETIQQVRANVEEVSLEYIKNLQGKLNAQFEVEHKEFKEILDVIKDKKANVNKDEKILIDQEIELAIEKLDYIKSQLDKIISEYASVLNQKQRIYDIYSKELENAMVINYENALSFEDIKKELEKNIVSESAILALFKPMLKFKFHKHLNLDKFFLPQDLFTEKPDDAGPNENSLDFVATELNPQEKLIKEINDSYIFYLSLILEKITARGSQQIMLSELLAEVKEENESTYQLIVNKNFFTLILLIFSNTGSTLNIRENYIEYKASIIVQDIEFAEELIVGQLVEKYPDFEKLKQLTIEKIDNTIINVGDRFKINDVLLRVV